MTTSERDGAATALVLEERRETITLLKLNRPEKHNAVNEQMSVEVIDALDRLEADDDVRVIILTGAGQRAFCAGADMAQASGRTERPQEIRGGGAAGIARRLFACEKPVIGAINGFCYGGGLSIALCCDIRLASETATFRVPGANYGLVVSATWLAGVVGPMMAKDLLFTARPFDAAEALRIGLVNRLTPLAELESLAWEYAQMIAGNSPIAIRYAKRVVNKQAWLQVALDEEAAVDKLLRGSDDHVARFNQAADRVLKSD